MGMGRITLNQWIFCNPDAMGVLYLFGGGMAWLAHCAFQRLKLGYFLPSLKATRLRTLSPQKLF
jgi:hypothetical protein